MKKFSLLVAIVAMILLNPLCFGSASAGFYVRNDTDKKLNIVSKSEFIKFADGIPAQSEMCVGSKLTKSFRLIFTKDDIDPQEVEVKEGNVLLFRINISVVSGEPILDIVENDSAGVKQCLYVPTIGGGYNFVLAVGNDKRSVEAEAVYNIQPGGIQPYGSLVPAEEEDSVMLDISKL